MRIPSFLDSQGVYQGASNKDFYILGQTMFYAVCSHVMNCLKYFSCESTRILTKTHMRKCILGFSSKFRSCREPWMLISTGVRWHVLIASAILIFFRTDIQSDHMFHKTTISQYWQKSEILSIIGESSLHGVHSNNFYRINLIQICFFCCCSISTSLSIQQNFAMIDDCYIIIGMFSLLYNSLTQMPMMCRETLEWTI